MCFHHNLPSEDYEGLEFVENLCEAVSHVYIGRGRPWHNASEEDKMKGYYYVTKDKKCCALTKTGRT